MSNIDISRRSFLRGRIREQKVSAPLPWKSADFLDQCSRCGDCISVCQPKILINGDGGYPQVDFSRGACTFCQACVDVCKEDAFDRNLEQPWALTASVSDQCLSKKAVVCRTCADHCEQVAIRFQLQTGGRADPIISDTLCNGCGACYAVCPTKAIQIQEAA